MALLVNRHAKEINKTDGRGKGLKNLVGKKFGEIIVLSRAPNDRWGNVLWNCKCTCGTTKTMASTGLLGGRIQSCGCLKKELLSKKNTIHGMTNTRVNRIWRGMKTRCYNTDVKSYQYYGEKGVKVCKRWRAFENFYKDMGRPPSKKHTLDRIDNAGDYCPKNCRWATALEQNNNKTSNRKLIFINKSQSVAEWARELKINYGTLSSRINRLGWPIEKALTKEIGLQGKREWHGN